MDGMDEVELQRQAPTAAAWHITLSTSTASLADHPTSGHPSSNVVTDSFPIDEKEIDSTQPEFREWADRGPDDT